MIRTVILVDEGDDPVSCLLSGIWVARGEQVLEYSNNSVAYVEISQRTELGCHGGRIHGPK